LSLLQNEHNRPAPAEVAVFALERPRDELRARIDRRVVAMFDAGLVDEVQALARGPKPLSTVAAQGVGYREVLDWLDGRLPEAELIPSVQTHTKQFAKRQGTWFRGLAEVRPWPVGEDEPPEVTADRLAEQLGPGRTGRPAN
jgi:tRNA dimethylallyltransferase